MKYRKKPVIIDAARYMIDKSLPGWFMDRVTDNTITIHEDGTCNIRTLEGIMKADRGDYIILGVNGEVYPCKPDIFEKTYDKVIEVEFCPGITIKEAVEELKERAKDGNAYCGRFNVWTFTSDMSVNDAYMMAMNDKCDQWNKEHYIGFSIYGSPIENTTYKFAKCLQKRFGIIKGITDRNYITNSYHTFVKEPINAFDKLAKEAEFQALSLGGAISYIETDGLVNNVDAVLEANKFIYDHIMYAEENTKSDYCQICGYDGEIKIIDEGGELIWECPNCHNRNKDKMNVARRTCGYIGTNYWGKGRTQEIKERYVHMTDIAEDL